MAFSRFTMTCLRDMAMAPLDRFTVTIIGSISGVRPTATAIAKKNACSQSPLLRPLIRNTAGTITRIKRIISQVKLSIPLSKLVRTRGPAIACASEPRDVSLPVVRTAAVAVPVSTFVPRKQRLDSSYGLLVSRVSQRSDFSTGIVSPVKVAWFTKRSLDESILTSAGTISPAARRTRSPGTRPSRRISWSLPSRITSTDVVTRARSFSAASSARAS